MNANTNANILIINKDRRKKIKSDYGIPYECVELIRRFFNQYYGLTFPSIKDAYEMFKKIDSLIHTIKLFFYKQFRLQIFRICKLVIFYFGKEMKKIGIMDMLQ